jgi:DNA-binding response OmpR family regulator
MRVLLLEDDPRLCESVAGRLRVDGHAVDQVGTLDAARSALMDAEYDCLVLDRLVPDGDALDLVADLEAGDAPPPMLVVSALGDGDERVQALQAGADDYIAKPARLDEVAIRVRKLLVRHTSVTRGPVRLGRVVVDRARRDVSVDGLDIHLTPLQYSVLEYLVAHRDRMASTEELLEHCWDRNRQTVANPLHSQICRLRRIFRGSLRIDMVRGAGYVLREVT